MNRPQSAVSCRLYIVNIVNTVQNAYGILKLHISSHYGDPLKLVIKLVIACSLPVTPGGRRAKALEDSSKGAEKTNHAAGRTVWV